jgi:hypothetical protein
MLFLGSLAVYVRTAAPSVMAGDSAEFQMAAALLGVPHPTTYPLYIMLGKLATLVIPFYDLARRVTLVSSFAAALAVAFMFLLARRVTGGTLSAVLAALALAVAPGLWNAATMAEVYALLAALMAAFGYFLIADYRLQIADWQNQGIDERRTTNDKGQQTDVAMPSARPLTVAAFIAGLAFSHHGLFAFTGMPLFAGYALWRVLRRRTKDEGRMMSAPIVHRLSSIVKISIPLAVAFILGLTPWLYTLIQYARYGPFHGEDYGLPIHYFWGSPGSWAEAANMLLGGAMRNGVFRMPTLEHAGTTVQFIGARLLFEFGPLGCALGALGCVALLVRQRGVWLGAAAVFAGDVLYMLLLGPAVQDAPTFTLPMLLPWALWVGVGAAAIGSTVQSTKNKDMDVLLRSLCFVLLISGTLAWGYTRAPYGNKRHQWLFREFGQATLQQLPPHSVVITHWEQGMLLQYLVLVEHQRPDVLVDVVEPSDVPWGQRAADRSHGQPVFFVGTPPDVAGLPIDLVRHTEYADLFRLVP